MTPDASDSLRGRPLYPCGQPLRQLPRPAALVVLGATGSIGRQTLELVTRFPDHWEVVAVAVRSRVAELTDLLTHLAQIQPAAKPPLVAVTDEAAHAKAAVRGDLGGRLLPAGAAALVAAVTAPEHVDCVVNGVVGAVGLAPTIAAAERGVRIALANKESLVVGGELVRAAVRSGGAELLPVDSEHSAIAQCLSGRQPEEIEKLVLTASGGPFRTMPAEKLREVTVQEVLAHPTWNMGPKITVDSATLMNKGLEVIEAHHLFGVPYRDIDVVVHPGSYVHSCVTFRDGAVMAQLGSPDMRVPLMYAMAGEKRWPLAAERLDLLRIGTLCFEPPDLERFVCLRLAREAGEAGGTAPIVLNAANEVAVAALLDGRLRYVDIASVIASTLAAMPQGSVASVTEALTIDAAARREAEASLIRLVRNAT